VDENRAKDRALGFEVVRERPFCGCDRVGHGGSASGEGVAESNRKESNRPNDLEAGCRTAGLKTRGYKRPMLLDGRT
jgi:hypothetical protein